MTTRLLIHIGYYKTGTTWLQREVFPHESLRFDLPFSRKQIATELAHPHPFDFDASRCQALFRPTIDASLESGRAPVISNERLSGAFLSGGYDSKEIADRLVRAFPEARILIVIREQRDMLRSAYSQYIRQGGVLRLHEFLDPGLPYIRRLVGPTCIADQLHYHRLIRYYLGLFGSDQVSVLPFEQLRDAPSAFLQSVLAIAGVEDYDLSAISYSARNVSLSLISLAAKRHINQILGRYSVLHPNLPHIKPRMNARVIRLLEHLDRRIPKRVVQQDRRRLWRNIADQMGDFFVASNRETAELTGLDLWKWGYQV
jgi:hypothetical protein